MAPLPLLVEDQATWTERTSGVRSYWQPPIQQQIYALDPAVWLGIAKPSGWSGLWYEKPKGMIRLTPSGYSLGAGVYGPYTTEAEALAEFWRIKGQP